MFNLVDMKTAKLEWSAKSGGSERQRRDIQGIVEATGDGLDRDYLARWVAELGLETEWAALAAHS